MNYLSGARAWLPSLAVAMHAFDSYLVNILKHGVLHSSNHIPSQAPPLLPSQIKMIVHFCTTIHGNRTIIIADILLGYFTLLRSSNLLHLRGLADQGHTLCVHNITMMKVGLNIQIHSSKASPSSAPHREHHSTGHSGIGLKPVSSLDAMT